MVLSAAPTVEGEVLDCGRLQSPWVEMSFLMQCKAEVLAVQILLHLSGPDLSICFFFSQFWCIRCKLGSESVATDIGDLSIFSHVDVELQTAEDSLP